MRLSTERFPQGYSFWTLKKCFAVRLLLHLCCLATVSHFATSFVVQTLTCWRTSCPSQTRRRRIVLLSLHNSEASKDPYRLGIYPYKEKPEGSPKNHTTQEKNEMARRSLRDDIRLVHVDDEPTVLRYLELSKQELKTNSSFVATNSSSDGSFPQEEETRDANEELDDVRNETEKNEKETIANKTSKQTNIMQQYPSWPDPSQYFQFSEQKETSNNNSNNNTSKPTNSMQPYPSWPDPSQYFQFPNLPQPFNASDKLPSRKVSFLERQKAKRDDSTNATMTLQDLFKGKSPTDILTVDDLQSMISKLKQSAPSRGLIEASSKKEEKDASSNKGPSSPLSSQSSVAFPQPSVLTKKSVRWGTTVAAWALGMILGASVLPNLWLMGSVVGAFYGYGVATDSYTEPPKNFIPLTILNLGRRLAKAYLQVYDYAVALFFMYKTGQLSYSYYQRYAELDQRFAIQNKIDSWNARFAEGKVAFDKWERENEVGRKVLAGLRTIWLVEERSLQKNKQKLLREQRRGQSRYRLVQIFYDAAFLMGRLIGSMWKTMTGRGGGELKEFLVGLGKWDMSSEDETLGARVGAALGACVVVNLSGALFAISPVLLTMMAMGIGILWPTWYVELTDSIVAFWDDRRARGRGEDPSSMQAGQPQTLPSTRPKTVVTRKGSRISRWSSVFIDKKQFHYYRKPNGEKRYYRVGKPWFGFAPWQDKAKNEHGRSSLWQWE